MNIHSKYRAVISALLIICIVSVSINVSNMVNNIEYRYGLKLAECRTKI